MRFRMRDFHADWGRDLNNGMHSTVSERLQSWLDADGSSVSYSYAWTVDGVDPGVSTASLSSTYFDRDQPVQCTVTLCPRCTGAPSGAAATSSLVTPSGSGGLIARSSSISAIDASTSGACSSPKPPRMPPTSRGISDQ